MKCTMTGEKYTVFGYKGKQVRDNIHSADLISCFDQFFRAPRSGEVYNIGGGRYSNASMLEAIELSEQISGCRLQWTYSEQNRTGDHIWWISDNSKFAGHYPEWRQKYDCQAILREIYEYNRGRWTAGAAA
jgi:CDP-paratose 2-epimerase